MNSISANTLFYNLPQRKPFVTHLTILSLAVGFFVFAGYTLSTSPAIAYSLFSLGAMTGGGLAAYAIFSCKKRAESSEFSDQSASSTPQIQKPEELVQKTTSVEKSESREQLKLVKEQLYQPNTHCFQIVASHLELRAAFANTAPKAEARNLLKEGRAGDYVISDIDQKKSVITIVYLDENLKVQECEINDPTVWSGSIYEPVYEKLLYPILPDLYGDIDPSNIHSVLIGCKWLSLLKSLDKNGLCEDYPMGILHNFLIWLKEAPSGNRFRFNPAIFLKVAGHIFGLLGSDHYLYKGANSVAHSEYTVEFEGFKPEFGAKVMMQDVLNYLPQSQLDENIREKIALMCTHVSISANRHSSKNPSYAQLMELLNQGVPITIFCGWNGHSVNITMTKEELCFSNRGDQAGQFPGIRKYKICKEVTEAVLKQLMELDSAGEFPNDSQQGALVELLGLKYLGVVKSTYQKVGSCVFASHQLAFKAAQLLLGVAPDSAQNEYKEYIRANKTFWLDAIFTLIDRVEMNGTLIEQLYFLLYYIGYKIDVKSCIKQDTKEQGRFLIEKILEKVKNLPKLFKAHYRDSIIWMLDENQKETAQNFPAERQHLLQVMAERLASSFLYRELLQ